jgi:hypothetical protein
MSEDDYCPEEEEAKEKAIGPKCDVCGKSTESLYPVLVKRERRGMYEMVQIYLCAFHILERMEEDVLPPPPEDGEKSENNIWNELMGPDEEEEEEDEDGDGGWSGVIDHIGQSFG